MPVVSEEEAAALGFHDVPDPRRLAAMSFVELASEFSSARPGTPKHIVIERELKRVLAKDQARANRSNIFVGGVIAGIFGLSGVVLGWWLRESSTMNEQAHSISLQQVQPGKFHEQSKVTDFAPGKPVVASQPVGKPAPAAAASNGAQGK